MYLISVLRCPSHFAAINANGTVAAADPPLAFLGQP